MRLDNPCPVCGKPIADTAYVCARCGRSLAARLLHAAVEWPNVEVTLSRQDLVEARIAGGAAAVTNAYAGPSCAPWQRLDECEHDSCRRAWETQREAARNAARVPRLPHEGALTFHYPAAEAIAVSHNTVTAWARLVHEERGVPIPADIEAPRRPEPVPNRDFINQPHCTCCDLPIHACQYRGAIA